MSKEAIVERILSDADADAAEIVKNANARAEAIVAAAMRDAASERDETDKEIAAEAERIKSGREAAARLDSAKIMLAGRRKVISDVYDKVLELLNSLEEKECATLCEKLLKENAESGDEIIFAENFRYAAAVEKLPVVKEKNLAVSPERGNFDGGIRLVGKICDKDLSFSALAAADAEIHQAELAAELFGNPD